MRKHTELQNFRISAKFHSKSVVFGKIVVFDLKSYSSIQESHSHLSFKLNPELNFAADPPPNYPVFIKLINILGHIG